MKKTILIFTGLAVFVLPVLVQAQWAISPHVVISVPRNEFANVDETGGGFGLKAVLSPGWLDKKLGVRGDFAFITFGKKRSGLVDSFGNFVPIESRNEGFRLTLGPEFRTGPRKWKIYAGINGGLYFFRTNITTQFFDFGGNFRSISDSEDNNFALGWNATTGLQFDIGLGPWIDISFEYQTIYDLPEQSLGGDDTEIDVTIPNVTANEYTIKFGVIFFLK